MVCRCVLSNYNRLVSRELYHGEIHYEVVDLHCLPSNDMHFHLVLAPDQEADREGRHGPSRLQATKRSNERSPHHEHHLHHRLVSLLRFLVRLARECAQNKCWKAESVPILHHLWEPVLLPSRNFRHSHQPVMPHGHQVLP